MKIKFAEAYDWIHGVVKEMMLNPPENVEYGHIEGSNIDENVISIPILNEEYDCDLIHSFDTTIVTDKNWVYEGSVFPQMATFSLLGNYYPREFRLKLLKNLLEKDNCKALIFPSQEGLNTIKSYSNWSDEESKVILDKCHVIPFAFRKINDSLINFSEANGKEISKGKVKLLFLGTNFIRKGGEQLLDAFEVLYEKYNGNIELNIISRFAEKSEFTNPEKTKIVLERAKNMKGVNVLNCNDDEKMKIYSESDMYIFPTMQENFGFSPIEAMGFGLPVVASNFITALPEIVEDGESGLLFDIMNFDFEKCVFEGREDFREGDIKFKVPLDLHEHMVKELIKKISILIEDSALRKRMGLRGLEIARSKFSFENRNRMLKELYESILKS